MYAARARSKCTCKPDRTGADHHQRLGGTDFEAVHCTVGDRERLDQGGIRCADGTRDSMGCAARENEGSREGTITTGDPGFGPLRAEMVVASRAPAAHAAADGALADYTVPDRERLDLATHLPDDACPLVPWNDWITREA